MNTKNKETIADIVADIRAQNQGLPEDGYALSPLVCDLLMIADRIEAAANRQFREVTKMIPHEEVDVSKMETTTQTSEKSSSVGNAAAMRETLYAITRIDTRRLKRLLCELVEADIFDGGQISKTISAVEKARKSISAPPRNCDVLSDTQEALAAIHEDRCYVNNPIDERRLTVEWLFAEAKGETDGSK